MISTSLKFVGNTPVYQLDNTNIFVKLEKYNAGLNKTSIFGRKILELQNRHNKIDEDFF